VKRSTSPWSGGAKIFYSATLVLKNKGSRKGAVVQLPESNKFEGSECGPGGRVGPGLGGISWVSLLVFGALASLVLRQELLCSLRNSSGRGRLLLARAGRFDLQ